MNSRIRNQRRAVVMTLLGIAMISGGILVPQAESAEIADAVDVRFAAEDPAETPDFQRHVVPLLGRLGCNGRECHGSFQGQWGFRLSLFGYDFAADHDALTAGERPRTDRIVPDESLILKKPTVAVEHGGGELFTRESWEYRLLRRWIEAGTPGTAADHAELVSLEVEPREIVFRDHDKSVSLRIIARWSDGTREDVTPLCRFRVNDEAVATVSRTGVVSPGGRGDTHVVVFYDNGITPIPVISPFSDAGSPKAAAIPMPTTIDALVAEKLRKVGLIPSEVCSDAEFLRRASLDITGTLPAPQEVVDFLADSSSNKRARKIEELLARPAYAAWWTTRICDWLGNSEANLPVGGEQGVRREKSAQWYDWIHRRVRDNVPYDEIVAGIVLGRGRRAEQNTENYFEEMSSYFRKENPADFSARDTMPYFWTRGRFTPPQPLRFSYAFLGVRLECAECHKHPYDQWTKADYEGFQTFFDGVGHNYSDRRLVGSMKETLGLTADQDSGGYKRLFAELAGAGKTVPWQEVTVTSLERSLERKRRQKSQDGKGAGRVLTPRLLGGEEVLATEYDDPREPLMEWLHEKDNPYFARTLVNRVWAAYFGTGIVDPPDDMNLANPPSNEPLLAHLADGFIAQGYDLKWLHREIASSRTYQLSWRPNAANVHDHRNFSRAQVRRLPAEVTYDAIVFATASKAVQQAMRDDPAAIRERVIGVSTGFSRNEASYPLNLFGKPPREGICDCERSNEPSLLQTIYLRNDREILALLDRRDGWLQELSRPRRERPSSDADDWIREAYLRTFSRPPTDEELENARAHFQEAGTPLEGLRDLLWALLNSKEFLLNH